MLSDPHSWLATRETGSLPISLELQIGKPEKWIVTHTRPSSPFKPNCLNGLIVKFGAETAAQAGPTHPSSQVLTHSRPYIFASFPILSNQDGVSARRDVTRSALNQKHIE